jgi:hypothetical protein
MSSKPLLFQVHHKQWQLKMKRERDVQLTAHNEQYYETAFKKLPG